MPLILIWMRIRNMFSREGERTSYGVFCLPYLFPSFLLVSPVNLYSVHSPFPVLAMNRHLNFNFLLVLPQPTAIRIMIFFSFRFIQPKGRHLPPCYEFSL
jgi:hypothetical protein